ELYPDSSFAGFFWQGRSNSKISTPEKDTLNNYIKIFRWNTIMTVYEFATNGNSKNTTKTYVNGSLANVNENGGVIAYTVGTTTPNDHINMHVYGTQGNSFEIDNVNYYMTNVAPVPDDTVLSMDGTADGNWAAASDTLGTLTHNQTGVAGKSDVYSTAGIDAAATEFRWLLDQSKFTPDASSYDYLVMSFQIFPKSDTDITKIYLGNRRHQFTATNLQTKFNIGQWNTVTTVYKYGENANTATAFETDTYINGELFGTKTDAPSVFNECTDHSDGGTYYKRIQLSVTAASGKSFGLDNVRIYQTNTYPNVTMPSVQTSTSYTLGSGELKVHKSVILAVSDLDGAKVWDSTLTTQITSGNITDGNIVTVEKDNKITYYTVSTGYQPGIYTISSFKNQNDTDFEKVTADAVGEWVAGIGGKAAADYSYKLTLGDNGTAGATAFIMDDTGWLRENKQANSQYVVFEMNFYPTNSVNNCMLKTNFHDGIALNADGTSFDCYDVLTTRRWNKIVTVLNIATGNTKTYLNGNLLNDSGEQASIFGLKSYYSEAKDRTENVTQVRLSFTSPVNPANGEAQIVYIDDVHIYEAENYSAPTVPTKFAQDGFAGNYVIDNDAQTLTIPAGTTVADAAAATELNAADCTTRIVVGGVNTASNNNTALVKNSLVVLENENMDYTYYSVDRILNNYDVVFGGAAYDSEYNEVTSGSLTVAVYKPDEAEISIVAAQFDKNDKLHKAVVNKVSGSGLVDTASFTVDGLEDSTVTVFVLENMSTIKPLADVTNVQYSREALKILCIGSSYGVDGTRYVQQMAASAGKKIVIANLYYGGCTLEQHDSFSSNNTANYTYYKNTNGTWTERPSSTMYYGLTDEDWDIITLQNGAAEGDKEGGYQPHLNNVINYVNTNKTNADAKLYWHQTWSYRDGSTKLAGTGYESAEQLYNNIISTYNTYVKELVDNGTFVGVIPTGTAVQNARQTAGLYNWDGTSLTDLLSRDDTTHLSFNYGRYLSGLVWVNTVAGVDIDDVTWTPAELGYDGFTNSEQDLANTAAIKTAAANAINNPFAVTK
ncbi:MAG: DUF4886 domain-containing protein, partial [Clostridia bacterium]|nr:DUF4886 domain-containing protein [Clostridia bacterium]